MIIGKKDYGIKAGRNCNTRIVIWLRIRKFFPFSVCFFFSAFRSLWNELTNLLHLSVCRHSTPWQGGLRDDFMRLEKIPKKKVLESFLFRKYRESTPGKVHCYTDNFCFCFFNRNPLIRVRSYRDNMQHIIVLFFSPRFKLGVFKIINRDHLVQVWILLINAQS